LAPVPREQSGQGSASLSAVRQLGTALGPAISGAVLAAGLAARGHALSGEAARYGQALADAAGSILPQLRAQHAAAGTLDQLVEVSADGSRLAIAASAGALRPGLLGPLALPLAGRRRAPAWGHARFAATGPDDCPMRNRGTESAR